MTMFAVSPGRPTKVITTQVIRRRSPVFANLSLKLRLWLLGSIAVLGMWVLAISSIS